MNKPAALASLFLLIAVVMGAFGAHALKPKIDVQDFDNYQTAVKYQFIHALTMLLLALNKEKIKAYFLKYSVILFSIGILFFCGSLYALSLKNVFHIPQIAKYIWFVTPLGGICFTSAWAMLFFGFFKK